MATHVLEGTSREPPNSTGSFGARLTQDHPVQSGEWTKVLFDEVLWDTGGMFDRRHGAFVAPRKSGPTARARNFTPNLVAARTGDVFEISVRHDVGAEVLLSSKDIDLPDDPQFAAPTANYFIGMYEPH